MNPESDKQSIKENNKKEAKGCLRIAGIYIGSAIVIIVLVKYLLDYMMK